MQETGQFIIKLQKFLSNVNVRDPVEICTVAGALTLTLLALRAFRTVVTMLFFFIQPQPPAVFVEMDIEESEDVLKGYEKFDYAWLKGETQEVHLFDPSTLDYFGSIPAMGSKEVNAIVASSRAAQAEWAQSTFAQRRLLMRTMQRCISRDTGRMMMMKQVRVEWVPLGVIGAIVPWNYPFHNVFNPVSAALFSGNSIVIKVSEYASWSIGYYKRIIDACLDAVGAPRDLVQFVVGYGEAGSALVSSGVDKVIFVGSPEVGAIVARTAAATLTPVVLELGGKDPFVVCDDADIPSIVQTACRGVWQNMGQNCAGPERFFVYDSVFDAFCEQVAEVANQLKTGPSLGDSSVDCGAICMGPNQIKKYQSLVDDAVKKGARVLAGGKIPSKRSALGKGSFYPPTVLVDVPEHARIAQEEIFGPIMCVFRVSGDSDDEAVRMANNCEFALSSCAFSGSASRAKKVASRLNAGMSAVNDLEGCTYMSQSLPFGGCKKSGYDRFAGPEGLRGLCMPRSICEDRFGFLRNAIPPPMHYPATGIGANFARGLINFFYNTSLVGNLRGVIALITNSNPPAKKAKSE
eukprot:GSChrysophyteH2.ASY1.ANO1.911.1 assembled CDS